jgi:hypothetical protein
MAERLSIISERVDDIPLLLAQLERMGVRSLLDEYFPACCASMTCNQRACAWIAPRPVAIGP